MLPSQSNDEVKCYEFSCHARSPGGYTIRRRGIVYATSIDKARVKIIEDKMGVTEQQVEAMRLHLSDKKGVIKEEINEQKTQKTEEQTQSKKVTKPHVVKKEWGHDLPWGTVVKIETKQPCTYNGEKIC